MKPTLYLLYLVVLNISCNSSKHFEYKTYKPISVSQLNVQNNFQTNGIDYLAEGNLPAQWMLKLNIEDSLYFKANDGNKFVVAFNFFSKTELINEYNYIANTKYGLIKINIKKNNCKLANDNAYDDDVTVKFKNNIYTGCGKYLKNLNIINNWTLYKIENNIINSDEYKKLPTLSFNSKGNSIIGFDGCSKYTGIAELQGNKIAFSNIKLSNATCLSNTFKKIIEEKINNRVVSYFFKNNDLVLYLIDDSMLYFKKN